MTVGVEQASDEDSVAVQGLGDLSDGTYKDICKELREQKKRNAWQLPRKTENKKTYLQTTMSKEKRGS